MKYRLSASTVKVYEGCKFRFYCKATAQETDGDTDQSYGESGTIVHSVLEHYYTHLNGQVDREHALHELESFFNNKWETIKSNVDHLNKEEYWLAVINAVNLNIKHTHLEHKFYFTEPVEFVGYADIMNVDDNWIGDWKTSTYKKAKVDEYKEQLKYYAYAYLREFKKIPVCWVFFNKENKLFKFKFDENILKGVEQELKQIKKDIEEREKTLDFPRNPLPKNCFFCPYKKVCASDLLRGKVEQNTEIVIHEKKTCEVVNINFHFDKNKLKIEGPIPKEVHDTLKDSINFEVKNAFFIKKQMAAKGIRWDGIKHLYKIQPYGASTYLGFMNRVYKALQNHYGAGLKVTIIDHRDKPTMEAIYLPEKVLKIDFKMYDYQFEAVEALIKNRWGICEIGTGGGKTAIAAECIRRLRTKTLFVIDNKDLLLQTKKEYEDMLGVECGIVGMGEYNWDKPIVLGTIQTLSKYVKEFSNQLSTVNLLILDEAHIIATKSYETLSKYLINTKWRFGFSATANRDDGNDNIIYAHTGDVVFKKRALDLIAEEVLVRPKAIFYQTSAALSSGTTWQNAYTAGIVDNNERNGMILRITNQYREKGKKIMILCRIIDHCKYLLEQLQKQNHRVDLIYGKTEDEVRVDILEKFKNNNLDILIGNIKIFNKGINIKNLDVLINATGNAGDITTIQTMGRILRKSPGKESAYYIDFKDTGEYLGKHARKRIESLKAEGYEVEIL